LFCSCHRSVRDESGAAETRDDSAAKIGRSVVVDVGVEVMVPIAQSFAASMKPSEVVATMDRQSAESWARD
jgi:hypothetical protein